jgi:ribosomal-protein-alanine N-acetyltransferase
MTIREYQEKDACAVCAINRACFKDAEPDSELLEDLKKYKTWVAVAENGYIQGFISGHVKHGIPYIDNVSVLELYRGMGIATELIETFEKSFSWRDSLGNGTAYWLQVASDNPAQRLYFDLGYRVESVDENFYGRGKHALCMHKTA